MGSRNEFPWLAKENVTSMQKATEILNEIPQTALEFCAFTSFFTR